MKEDLKEILLDNRNEIKQRIEEMEDIHRFNLSIEEKTEFLNFILMRELTVYLKLSHYLIRTTEEGGENFFKNARKLLDYITNLLEDYEDFLNFMEHLESEKK